MKIGSAERADEIYRRGEAGLRSPSQRCTRALPGRLGLIYFRVIRESQEEEWKNVQKTLSMAIRVNEHRVEGSQPGPQGKQVLTIKPGGVRPRPCSSPCVVPPGK
jgi:hypothetical protein